MRVLALSFIHFDVACVALLETFIDCSWILTHNIHVFYPLCNSIICYNVIIQRLDMDMTHNEFMC